MNFRTNIKPRKINKIFTHCRKHEDEYITIAALKKFGNKVFIGIRKAVICLVKDTDDFKAPKDGLGVGVGHGILDDHKSDGRHDKDCAFGILSKTIKLPYNKRMGQLLKEIRSHDLTAHTGQTCLATIIKKLHCCEGHLCDNFDEAFDDVLFPVYDSILRYCSEKIELTGSYLTFCDYIDQSMDQLSQQYTDEVILWCKEFCRQACYNPEKRLTDVGTALRIYQRTHGKEKAKMFASFVISGLCHQRQLFVDGIKDLEKAKVVKIKTSDESTINAFVVESDNPTLIKSFRLKQFNKFDVHVLIQRNSSGHTQIFKDGKKHSNINCFYEKLSEAEKQSGGNGHWYNHRKTDAEETIGVFNGSQSYPDVPPTVLDLKNIIKVLAA
jgi:hypothetical protein